MPLDSIGADIPSETTARRTSLAISPWVNEPLPPLAELLSTHDVARLLRRPSWVLLGLSLIGRFPRKLRFHGRRVGWCRSEIIDWMSREVTMTGSGCADTRRLPNESPAQLRLPLVRTSCRPKGTCNGHHAASGGN